jgi:hypothetical protein
MPSATDVLVDSLVSSKNFIVGYCRDLTPAEYLHRTSPSGNCVAWLLGHLSLTDRRVSGLVLGADAVASYPPLPDGFDKRFGQKDGAPQAADFGDTADLLATFERTRDRFVELVREVDPAILDRPVDHPRFKTVYGAINFVGGAHTAMHAGQITAIRRSLGRPPLF